MKRLAYFIKKNTSPIIDEWEKFAHSIPTGAPKMSSNALRDHLPQILSFIAWDIGTTQSHHEQKIKSQGGSDKTDSTPDTAAEIHGVLRLENGFDIKQMISEFRALRASVIKLWIHESKTLNKDQVSDLIRFNEAIDQALAESVSRFTRDLDASKDLFLGILGHDIRNPLGAISMSATLLQDSSTSDVLKTKLAKQIGESANRIQEIVSHLLELTKARLGAKIPLVKQPLDFGETTQRIVAEIQAMHPNSKVNIDISGNVKGLVDKARFEQAFSNLMANAVQYGEPGLQVDVAIQGDSKAIRVSVHNTGRPIPPSTLSTIFESLVRGDEDAGEGSTNLGLGLFIVKSIVRSHGGEMSVSSTEADGTTFVAVFPRKV